MAIGEFPLMTDVQRDVMFKLDQPLDSFGQLTWEQEAEFCFAARAEFRYLWERIQSLDRSWGLKVVDSVSIASGNRAVSLPSDCRAIRSVFEISSAGADESSRLFATDWNELGESTREWVYRPDLQELYMTMNPRGGHALRVIYYYHPPELVHGLIRSATATTLTLGLHETTDDDRVNGRTIFLVDDGSANQSGSATDYAGGTRLATLDTTLSPVPSVGCRYTCRPEIPAGAYDAFLYGIAARMLEKNGDEVGYNSFILNREKHLQHLKTEIMTQERSDPMLTPDTSEGSHSGDYWDFY